MEDIRNCECCGKTSKVHVAASNCGPISFAYCEDCLKSGAEPYGALLGHLSGAFDIDQVDDYKTILGDSLLKTIEATLELNSISEEKFIDDLKGAIVEYIKALNEWEEKINGGNGRLC